MILPIREYHFFGAVFWRLNRTGKNGPVVPTKRGAGAGEETDAAGNNC